VLVKMEADTGAKRGASVEKEDAIGDATARYAMASDVPLSAGEFPQQQSFGVS